MAIYAEVEGIGRLEFPDGTDPEVIRATVKRVVGKQQPQPNSALNSSFGGFLRGMRDPLDAGAQLLQRSMPDSVVGAIDSFGNKLADLGLPVTRTDHVGGGKTVDDIVRAAESDYRQGWRQGQDVGADWGRLAGNIVATAPLLPSGVGAAATAGKLAASGAKAGAIGGALQPVQESANGNEFWGQKLKQGAIGGATGAAVAPVASKAIGAFGDVVNAAVGRARGAITKATPDEAWRITVDALKSKGIDPAQINDKTRNELVAEVQAALSSHGAADPAKIARLADFKAAGIDPLRSWVTRDPVQWTTEANLSGIQKVGEPLQYAKSRATNRVAELLDQQSPNMGDVPADAYSLGRIAASGVQKADKEAQDTVDTLYQLFRDTAPNVSGNPARFNNNLATMLDESMVGGQLPGDFVARLQAIQSGKFPLTPSTLFQMQKAASAQSKGNPALGIFKKAVEDEMAAMADDFGPTMALAKETLLKARGAARERFSLQDAVPAFKQAAAGELEPEAFFRQHVLSASVGEVRQLLSAVKDQEAHKAIAAQLVGYLKQTAFGTATQDNPALAQAAFNKALAAPGMPQKLELILGKAGTEEVKRAGRIAEMVVRAPSGNEVNTSKTSQAVANYAAKYLNNMAGVPIVGPWITEPLTLSAERAAVKSATNASGLLGARSPALTIDDRRARTIAGLLAGPSGLFMSGEFAR